MSRTNILDQAALLCLRLEADDRGGAAEMAALLKRLAARRSFAPELRAELAAAVEAARGWAAGGDGVAALERIGNALERAAGREPVVRPAPAPPEEATAAAAPPPAPDPMLLFDEPQEPTGFEADPELLEAFAAESAELLQQSEAVLLELEADPADRERLNTVFRCFHTIKGTSSFLGLDAIGRLAHRAESLLARARDGKLQLTGTHADLALAAVDTLGLLVRAAAQGEAVGNPERIEALVCSLDAAAAGEPEVPAAAPDAAPRVEPSEPTSPEGAESAPRPRAADSESGSEAWVRVRTDRLDRLVEMVGELVIAHAMIAQDGAVSTARDALNRNVGHAGKIVRELQDLSISMRMVPLKPLFQRLARVARDAAQRTGKRVSFVMRGEETELDRTMVETLSDPLVHMIRNAVDHGIEERDERAASGKAADGIVEVAAYHAGGNLVVELRDDGRGLDRDRILEKAVRQGIADRDRSYSDADIFELIFAAGFSTAAEVTALSGRGVGMDVVRRGVESLRGRIEITSEKGRGSTFTIRLPLTLAITDGMLVRVGRERFIIPTVNIQLSFRPEAKHLSTVTGSGELVLLRDELLPVLRLHELFTVADAARDAREGLLVVVGAGERRCALLVDELLGQQQVVAKALGSGIGKVQGVSGGAILGDGRVGLILDVPELIGLARESRAAA